MAENADPRLQTGLALVDITPTHVFSDVPLEHMLRVASALEVARAQEVAAFEYHVGHEGENGAWCGLERGLL